MFLSSHFRCKIYRIENVTYQAKFSEPAFSILQFFYKNFSLYKNYTCCPNYVKCILDHSFVKIINARISKMIKTCILPLSNKSKTRTDNLEYILFLPLSNMHATYFLSLYIFSILIYYFLYEFFTGSLFLSTIALLPKFLNFFIYPQKKYKFPNYQSICVPYSDQT